MTQVDFYTNAPDKQRLACRITLKAYGLGHKITLFCPDAGTAAELDRLLWTVPPTAFVPHCAPEDPLAAVTPVIIDYRGETLVQDQVLVNLTSEQPAFFARFERLIEIVTAQDEDRRRARERYRYYRDRGYALRQHDLAA
jgi:DNA polymerase III subunit chi